MEESNNSPVITVANPLKVPVMKFKDEQHAKAICDDWQKRLYLTNWAIKIEMVDNIDNDVTINGQIKLLQNHMLALIKIRKDCLRNSVVIPCHEAILLHELLHVMYQTVGPIGTNDPVILNYNNMIERETERMTRAFIGVKYNLPYNWFDAQANSFAWT